MNDINVRKADTDDLDIIMMIIDDAAIWMHENGIRIQWTPGSVYDDTEYYKKALEEGDFFVVQIRNDVVGTFQLRSTDETIWGSRDKDACYLHHFAVDRLCTGSGLGDAILKMIEEDVRRKNKKYLRLDCIAANAKLNRYYLERGFKSVGEYVYSDGKIGNLYEKSL